MIRVAAFALALLCAAATVMAEEENHSSDRWEFDVYVDDKRIGNHVFELVQNGSHQQSVNTAEFRYRVLLIPAWRYSHTNTEQWNEDGCLEGFEASTRVNGKQSDVSAAHGEDGLIVDTGEATTQLPGCIMSFAYWDPRFLEQARLIDPQTGKYLPITVERLPAEALEVRGAEVPAQPYRVRAEELDLKVYYSEENEWLALESVGKGGRVIRYELT
ncbi:MAG: DUF6134 family protein [Woeseiaceae bacterium]|nr:DUF6134 family protein [Woeseiaceae bacterium]